MKEIIKVHDSLITCAPVHSQWAALATFEIFDDRTVDVRKKLQSRRDYTIEKLNTLKQYIDFMTP
jgi:aspartate/methionine/tyrosine aminotransferase